MASGASGGSDVISCFVSCHALWLAIGLTVAALGCSAAVDPSIGDDMLLRGYQGPYVGRVVDAQTRRPLEAAVVVAMWERKTFTFPLQGHPNVVLHAVRETLTDGDGRFVIDAKEVEQHAPPRTYRPSFQVYYPGYFALAHLDFKTRGGFGTSGGFSDPLHREVEVGLPRATTREDRIRAVGGVHAGIAPYAKVPLLLRYINQERRDLSLGEVG
jgi:hypothetical protein